jgi:hypothetical protein
MSFVRIARRAGLAVVLSVAACAAASAAPACGGVDLVEKMRRSDKAGYQAYRADAAKIPNAEGLLWRVEKPGVAPSHLFGTFHASDATLMATFDRAIGPLRASTQVATELGDLSKTSKTLALARVTLSAISASNHSLSLISDPKKREKIVAMAASRGIDGDKLDALAPWMLIGLFALPACELAKADRQAVDDRVVEIGKETGAQIEALETIDEQVDALSQINPKLVGDYLSLVADKPAIVEDGFRTMVGLYARSHIGAALPALKHGLNMSEQQFAMNDAFSKRLLGDRNEIMRKRSTPLLEKGKAFIAVGALHLSGPDGLVALLRRDGWIVTKVF